MKIVVSKHNHDVAVAFADFFARWLVEQPNEQVAVALSGGSTPQALFRHWSTHYRTRIDWRRIHFFWGDERCVPPADAESNFGMTRRLLFDHIAIPEVNIHRIRGEEPPRDEAMRYASEIQLWTPSDSGLPVFDLIILGMGTDGHTASIFPDQMALLSDQRICAVAIHPESGQKRVTLTGPVINAARTVAFLVTGAAKAPIVGQILQRAGDYGKYPAAHITARQTFWFLDQDAAKNHAL